MAKSKKSINDFASLRENYYATNQKSTSIYKMQENCGVINPNGALEDNQYKVEKQLDGTQS